jgi:two-component system response regulator AtoC
MTSVLVVDDDLATLKTLNILLERNGYDVTLASSGEEALEIVKCKNFDLVLTDLKMREKSGIDVLKEVKENNHYTEVILLTAYGTITSAVEAIKLGAFDYVTKPCRNERLLLSLQRALEKKKLVSEVRHLRSKIRDKTDFIVYRSKAMEEIISVVKRIASTDVTVLIEGESGTGKELLAKAIHENSTRANKPFVAVNCSGLPETLLESELFGHKKGAFTGAVSNKKGLFDEADCGTIFLDEICDTSPSLQSKLLRVIQEQEIRRVGENHFTKINVRVITATNRNLLSLVKEGKFREDLYFRLNVMPVYVPPLRERKEDIILLTEFFVKKYSQKFKKKIKKIASEVFAQLIRYNWPGNVRELENTIERAVALTQSSVLNSSDLFFFLGKKNWLFSTSGLDGTSQEEQNNSLKDKERDHIIDVLKKNNWNYTRAAKELDIGRTTLWRKLKDYKKENL